MCTLTPSDRAKLGNAVVYIAQRTPRLSKTKLLKLLYLMEEESVRLFHTPFTGLPFEVWQAGPVAKDVFIDLSESPVLLDGYVRRVVAGGKTYIEATRAFEDDEFSDNDLRVMEHVMGRYGGMTAKALVALTHEAGTLWRKTAARNGLLELFEKKLTNNSDVRIDFGEELTEDGRAFYEEQVQFLATKRAYERPI